MATTTTLAINEAELPALVGSEKQIVWATDIRRAQAAWLNDSPAYADSADPFVDRMLNRLNVETSDDEAVARQAIADGVRRHFAQAEARYWIDKRDVGVENCVYALARPALLRAKNRRSVERLRGLEAAGTITDGQRARLGRLLASRDEWDS